MPSWTGPAPIHPDEGFSDGGTRYTDAELDHELAGRELACRDCGEPFVYNPDADRCPACILEMIQPVRFSALHADADHPRPA